MRYLTLGEVLETHRLVIEQTGGAEGVREWNALDSAVAQPQMTFGGSDLYPSLTAKATALCYSLVLNHPFVDGNKRVGHAAMETFLLVNGFELIAGTDDAERTILSLAAGDLSRASLLQWVEAHVQPVSE